MSEYNKPNGSSYNRVAISTSGMAFFDENSMLMKCGFLDEGVSISISTPVVEGFEGKKTYPLEQRENLVLTKDRVAALYELICRKVLPAIESGETYNGGVCTSMRKDAVFEIRVEGDSIYAAYHKEINPETRLPRKSVLYKFGKTPVLEKYDAATGGFNMDEIQAQFLLFAKMLEGFLLVGGNGNIAHGYRLQEKYTTDKILAALEALAGNFGIAAPASGGYTGGPAQIVETNSLSDLPF